MQARQLSILEVADRLHSLSLVAADDAIARTRELRERILSLERRAVLLTQTADLQALRAEARSVAGLLQMLEIALRGNPTEEIVQSVDDLCAAAADRIRRFG